MEPSHNTRPSQVSVIVLNWCRPKNVEHIIEETSAYSEVAEILVGNNNWEAPLEITNSKVRVINPGGDTGLRLRWLVAMFARCDVLLMQDDDLLLPQTTVQTLRDRCLNDPRRAYGIEGRCLKDDGSFYDHQPAYGQVDVLLGRTACLHRDLIPFVLMMENNFFYPVERFPRSDKFPGDDIFLSFCVKAYAQEYPESLELPYADLDASGGLSSKPGHLRRRNEIVRRCERFFRYINAVDDARVSAVGRDGNNAAIAKGVPQAGQTYWVDPIATATPGGKERVTSSEYDTR